MTVAAVDEHPRCAVRRTPEVIAQALAGLMAVHGRDHGRPRRLGLDVASVATMILAAQGTRAAWLGHRRGLAIDSVETSVLAGALAFVAHHLAISTSGDPLTVREDGPGPPFPTADGHWVELEVLTPAAWAALWDRLGVERAVSAAAWSAFVLRYLAGSCVLPAALHAATRRHVLAELRAAADASEVELCRVRRYAELRTAPAAPAPWTLSRGATSGGPLPGAATRTAGPLSGMRVVEMATRLQGPLAGRLLWLLGASVIKVEPPGGDIGRRASRGFGWAAYRAYNHGKRVVEIDVKRASGRDELQALVADAEVFLHNAPPGRAERLGFAVDDLAAINPTIVHAHASGWGASGPTRIAGDFLVQAHAGCADGLTPAGEQPLPSRVTILDVIGGLLACDAILAGLCLREREGCGCAVQTSLLAAAGVLQGEVVSAIASGREVRRRDGRPLWGPLDEPLQTEDGWLAVDAASARARHRLAASLGLGTDDAQIARQLRRRTARDVQASVEEAGVAAAIVCEDLRALARHEDANMWLDRLDDGCCVPRAPWLFG